MPLSPNRSQKSGVRGQPKSCSELETRASFTVRKPLSTTTGIKPTHTVKTLPWIQASCGETGSQGRGERSAGPISGPSSWHESPAFLHPILISVVPSQSTHHSIYQTSQTLGSRASIGITAGVPGSLCTENSQSPALTHTASGLDPQWSWEVGVFYPLRMILNYK